jgi:hypothetical protein
MVHVGITPGKGRAILERDDVEGPVFYEFQRNGIIRKETNQDFVGAVVAHIATVIGDGGIGDCGIAYGATGFNCKVANIVIAVAIAVASGEQQEHSDNKQSCKWPHATKIMNPTIAGECGMANPIDRRLQKKASIYVAKENSRVQFTHEMHAKVKSEGYELVIIDHQPFNVVQFLDYSQSGRHEIAIQVQTSLVYNLIQTQAYVRMENGLFSIIVCSAPTVNQFFNTTSEGHLFFPAIH